MARARQDPDVIEPLRQLHAESTATRHDAQRYAMLAARFHEQVIELAGNKTLTLIGLILLEIVESHNQATFAALDREQEIVEHAQDDHATLIGMIERGDAEASSFWRQHMRGATDAAFEALGADAPDQRRRTVALATVRTCPSDSGAGRPRRGGAAPPTRTGAGCAS